MLKLERNILFGKTPRTYPLSNSRARNLCFLFSDGVCEKYGVDIFVGGSNDINYVLKTIEERTKDSKICFSLNDVEEFILARVFLLLVLNLVEKDIDFIFQVRCSQFLTKEHSQKLKKYLNWTIKRMEEDGENFSHTAFTRYNFLKNRFSYDSKESYEKILMMLKFWRSDFDLLQDLVAVRNKFMVEYLSRLYARKWKIEDVPGKLIDMARKTFSNTGGMWQNLMKEYIRSGIFLSHNRNIIEHTEANPTFFSSRNGGEYSTHPTSNPYESFEEDEEFAIFKRFQELVRKFRKNKKAHYRFVVGDILSSLMSGKRKYDFIFTSNISDNLGVVNLLLASKESLKNENSCVEVETMKMKIPRCSIFYRMMVPFSSCFLPRVFDLKCVSENIKDDGVSTLSYFRETATSCRLYFQPSTHHYPFEKSGSLYPYEFDFVPSEKDELLEELFCFLHVILKYKGMGVSHTDQSNFSENIGIPLSPNLTLNSFFYILKNLNLSESNAKIMADILLLKKRELIPCCCTNSNKAKDIEILLGLYQVEIQSLLHLHFPSIFDGVFSESNLNVYKLDFTSNITLERFPILVLALIKSKQKISNFRVVLDDNQEKMISIEIPMLESNFEYLRRNGERCFLMSENKILRTGEDMSRLYECFDDPAVLGGYSLPQDFSDAVVQETLKSRSTLEEVEGEEQEQEQNDMNDVISWRMNKDEVLCKVYVSGNTILEEQPKFVVEKDNEMVSIVFSKKKFQVKLRSSQYNMNEVKFQRSKKRKKIIIRFQNLAKERASEIFKRRIARSNKLVFFEDLKPWDIRNNANMIDKLAKVMFSMDELIMTTQQRENGYAKTVDYDHGLRHSLFYIFMHFLSSLGTSRVIVKDKNLCSGMILACCGMRTCKKLGLPMFEVIYRYEKAPKGQKISPESFGYTHDVMGRILKGNEEHARLDPELVELMNKKSEGRSMAKVDWRRQWEVYASPERQELLLNLLEENRAFYNFQSDRYNLGQKKYDKLFKRSVIYPLLPKVGK